MPETKFVVNGRTIEAFVPRQLMLECSHPGRCDDDVARWVKEVRTQLDELPAELIAATLKPYGAWNEEELQDHEQNLNRFIWCIAGSEDYDIDDDDLCVITMEAY